MQRRSLMKTALLVPLAGAATAVRAHHGWSSFDQNRPVYLEGKAAEVMWRNPHVELVLEVPDGLKLPADLAQRPVPAQVAPVDGKGLLAKAVVPTRRDKRWQIELAPLFRVGQWQMPEIKPGASLSLVGFTFEGERGEPVLRAEYVYLDGKVYALRSSPA